jgi:integrase
MKLKQNLFSAINTNKFLSIKLKLCLIILDQYNCRASEILNAKWEDYYFPQFLILKGLKNSADVVIRDRFLLNEIETKIPRQNDFIFADITYYHLYSSCKKYYSHLFLKFKGKKNFKVTHGFRYRNVAQLTQATQVKAVLNHNSLRSGKYYNKLAK